MADDKTKVLEQTTELVLKIALDLDQQRPAREQCLDSVAIKVLDVHFLEPAGLHDACDASRIVAVVLVDLHLQHRFAWRASIQITGRSSRASSVQSQVAVGPVSSPTRTAP